jgi:hypothetical protein
VTSTSPCWRWFRITKLPPAVSATAEPSARPAYRSSPTNLAT